MTVLITGAASGIGLAQFRLFFEQGHRVIGLDRQAMPNEWQERISLNQDSASFFKVDLTDLAQLKKVFEQIEERVTSLHVLCLTAGQLDQYANIEETSWNDWQSILATNLTAAFSVTKLALPLMLKNASSRLIVMGSIAGLTAGGGGIAYTTSKHALIGFTKQMAYDYSRQGLRANVIAPGAIVTPMNLADFQEDAKMAHWVQEQTPIGRWAQAEEVAQLSLFLASDAADYIQASVIPIDGGWLNR